MKHTVNHSSQKILAVLMSGLLVSASAYAADSAYIKINPSGSAVATAADQGNVAIGSNANAALQSAVAIGTSANAKGNGAVALGPVSQASGTAATAFGLRSEATANGAVALGHRSKAIGGAATAVGQGARALEENAAAFGTGAVAEGVYSLAAGLQSRAVGGTSVAIGRAAMANDEYSVALGSNSVTAAAVGTNEATVNGITYSGFAGNTPEATVSVGRAGAERTITNVAAGRIDAASTDAINGSQLYLVADQVGKNVADIAAAKTELVAGDNVAITSVVGANNQTVYTVSANSSSTAAGSDYITVTPSTTTGANGVTNTTYAVDLSEKTKAAIQNMANIDNRLDDMEDDLRAGIAGATAIAFLQRPNEAGKSIVSAAVGGFRDQQALAVGYARNSDNNKWSIKAGVGVNTQKDVNWGGSVGYQW